MNDQSIVVMSDSTCLDKIREFVRPKAEVAGLENQEVGRLVLAVDEICSNIVKHSYRFEAGHTIAISWKESSESVVVEVQDDSPEPCLPSSSDFEVTTKVQYRHSSGYGRYLLNTLVDDVVYETVPGGHNKVFLIKHKRSNTTSPDQTSSPEAIARRAVVFKNYLDVEKQLDQKAKSEALGNIFLNGVMGFLFVRSVAWLTRTEDGNWKFKGSVGLSSRLDEGAVRFLADGELVRLLSASELPMTMNAIRKKSISEEEASILEKLRAVVVVPVRVGGNLSALVVLGAKRTQSAFSAEEMQIVESLAARTLLLS